MNSGGKVQASAQDKVYKIRYCLNILPSMNLQNDKDLMEAIVNTEELAIFKTVALMSMADFKWTAYAFNSHKIGCGVHFI